VSYRRTSNDQDFGKKAKWIYWALTGPFVVKMMMAGLTLLAGAAG
jgi:hypothetical protein